MRRLLTAVLLGVLLLVTPGCMPTFGDKLHITALMGDTAGLFVGNDVGILGVPVGTVTAIKPDGAHVRVEMEVDGGQRVPADAGAVVVARSVATDRYVELTPVYREGPRMKDGAVITQDRTRAPVDFDDVLGALNEFAAGIAGNGETKDAIKNLLKAGSKTLTGRGEEFNRAITALGGAVDSISSQRGNITATVKSLDTLVAAIAANQGLVREFIDHVSDASSLLADERKNFQSALESLGDAVETVAEFAKANRQELITSLDLSSDLMDSLMTKQDRLEEILSVMPVTLENLRNARVGDQLQVRVDPLLVTPIGGIVDQLCSIGTAQLCAAFGPSLLNLQNILALLGGGL